MRLLECQGKELFREAGIPVPNGRTVVLPDLVEPDSYPVVVKAQILAGGRGKAGCDKGGESPFVLICHLYSPSWVLTCLSQASRLNL